MSKFQPLSQNDVLVHTRMGGGKKSVKCLERLKFDPIQKLVEQYDKLQEELEYQEKLRSGAIIELNVNEKPRNYRAEIHMSIHDKLANISDKLLRYGYGRVSETTVIEEKVQPNLVINLTKK